VGELLARSSPTPLQEPSQHGYQTDSSVCTLTEVAPDSGQAPPRPCPLNGREGMRGRGFVGKTFEKNFLCGQARMPRIAIGDSLPTPLSKLSYHGLKESLLCGTLTGSKTTLSVCTLTEKSSRKRSGTTETLPAQRC